MNIKRLFGCVLCVAGLVAETAQAETVIVKYRGEVDLAPFACRSDFTSSFIERICYDSKAGHMLIAMKPTTWYQYCDVPSSVFEEFHEAESKGSYYNKAIKGRYGCPAVRTPTSVGQEDQE